MRRSEWEVTDPALVETTLLEAETLHLAMAEDNRPYVVTLHFGYRHGVLYLHSSYKGKKAAILQANPQVAFCAESRVRLVPGETACKWGASYRSVAGTGTARFLETAADKLAGLQVLMAHYTDQPHPIDPLTASKTAVIAVEVEEMACQWKE